MQDDNAQESTEETLMYLQFKFVLSDVSAFLVDGDYSWSQTTYRSAGPTYLGGNTFLPIIDRCGVILALEQVAIVIFLEKSFLLVWQS